MTSLVFCIRRCIKKRGLFLFFFFSFSFLPPNVGPHTGTVLSCFWGRRLCQMSNINNNHKLKSPASRLLGTGWLVQSSALSFEMGEEEEDDAFCASQQWQKSLSCELWRLWWPTPLLMCEMPFFLTRLMHGKSSFRVSRTNFS